MTIRCDKCGELVWFNETAGMWLTCTNCGKAQENPHYVEKPKGKDND
jgi:hypothetical protein